MAYKAKTLHRETEKGQERTRKKKRQRERRQTKQTKSKTDKENLTVDNIVMRHTKGYSIYCRKLSNILIKALLDWKLVAQLRNCP